MRLPAQARWECECEFVKLEDTDEGRIATVEATGTATLLRDRVPRGTPLTPEVRDIDVAFTGTVRINVDTGLLLEQSLDFDGATVVGVTGYRKYGTNAVEMVGTLDLKVTPVR